MQVNGITRVWGDVDCSMALDPVEALKILRNDAGLPDNQPAGCPGVGDLVFALN